MLLHKFHSVWLCHMQQLFLKANHGENTVNKQLLDEIEHDIMNYQHQGLCYLAKPKAEADNRHEVLIIFMI